MHDCEIILKIMSVNNWESPFPRYADNRKNKKYSGRFQQNNCIHPKT
jgi:hypothetical protein